MYRVRREWTVREVELDPSLATSRLGMLRWFAVSLGLMSEKDRRNGMIFVLDALFTHWFKTNRSPSFEDLKFFVTKRYLEKGMRPPTDEAIRHHLRRLASIGFLYRRNGLYFLSTDPARPDDPLTAVDNVFSQILQTKELIRAGLSHLKNLYY